MFETIFSVVFAIIFGVLWFRRSERIIGIIAGIFFIAAVIYGARWGMDIVAAEISNNINTLFTLP